MGSSFSAVCTFAAVPLKPFLISVIPATSQILVPKVAGIIASGSLYQQSRSFSLTLPLKERPVPERYLTADTEGFRPLRAILAVRQLHRESQEVAGAL